MSASSRDRAAGIVGTLVVTGLGFIVGGWVLGVVCLFFALVLSLVLWTPVGPWLGFHADSTTESMPNSCKERLSRLAQGANHLEHELRHFWNWWPAVKDEAFEGRLSDDLQTTHTEAMQALLFPFALFFSAARTYQEECRADPDRAEIRGLLDQVYDAFGEGPYADAETTLNSKQLRLIGELSTDRRGEADARPRSQSDFENAMENDPRLAAALKPLKEFLRSAAPDTPERARLGAAERAIKSLREILGEKGYHR